MKENEKRYQLRSCVESCDGFSQAKLQVQHITRNNSVGVLIDVKNAFVLLLLDRSTSSGSLDLYIKKY